MEIKQLSKKLVIAGTLLIWLIKFVIRPYMPVHHATGFFLGVAPNFFGSFLIPFGACWFFGGKRSWLARFFKTETVTDVRQVCVVGFILLVLNEYLQLMPVFGRTFDYYDIFFSAVGLLISFFVFSRLLLRYRAEVS